MVLAFVYISLLCFQIENTTLLLNLSHIYYIMFYIYYKEQIYTRLIIVLMYVLYLFYSFARYFFFVTPNFFLWSLPFSNVLSDQWEIFVPSDPLLFLAGGFTILLKLNAEFIYIYINSNLCSKKKLVISGKITKATPPPLALGLTPLFSNPYTFVR